MRLTKSIQIGLVVLVLAIHQGAGFGFMGGMMADPGTVLNAARYMTQILMRNMAQKRTPNMACIDYVSRSTVTFFNEAAVSLQLGRLLQMTMRSSARPVPLDSFCKMANVRRLRAASVTFVSRMSCLGGDAVEDTDRLFRSLVYTIEHVCKDGGKAATQFMKEAAECRSLDAKHEEHIGQLRRVHRNRRGVTLAPLLPTSTAANTTQLIVTLPSLPSEAAAVTASDTINMTGLSEPPASLLAYSSLQACFDDVNELLPSGAQLSAQEQLTDFLLTLPALLPKMLQQNGLSQFCPALLKGADCAHLALRHCPLSTQKTMARWFRSVLRDILCDAMPDDEILKDLIWSDQVKRMYFDL